MRMAPKPHADPPPAEEGAVLEKPASSCAHKAGWSGSVFAALLVVSLVLVSRMPGLGASGMDMITPTGPARTAGVLPLPAVLVSYLVAAFLLVSTTFHPAVLLVFPAWVLLVSILLLVRRPKGATA
jgi:hypothetical protein